MNAEMVRLAIDALERVADDAARALVLVRALERPVDPPAPRPDTPAGALPTVECPDPETWRAHLDFHHQLADGSWSCRACSALERAP